MNVLIVYAHPEPKSLNGSIKDFYVNYFNQNGHLVRVSELYQMNWKDLAPVISNTVRDAFMRTDPKSFAAAMAIVHSKRLDNINQLTGIKAPLLVIPGNDKRHNSNSSETYLELVSNCELGKPFDWNEIKTIDQLASEIAPQIIHFTQKIIKNKK